MGKLIGTLIVPVGLAIILVPFSLLIGWNLATLLIFWFVLIPGIAVYSPTIVSHYRNHIFESLAGLTIFYGLMVFGIYDHYESDYFQIMTWSFAVNLVLVTVIIWARVRIQGR